jgi:hypothetical protein
MARSVAIPELGGFTIDANVAPPEAFTATRDNTPAVKRNSATVATPQVIARRVANA